MKHAIVLTISILVSMTVNATPMVRVVAINNSRSVIVDRNSVAAQLPLADIVLSAKDEAAAVAWLNRILVGSWVLVETNERGESYLYRSPDGLFVNGALARRAYLESGPQMIYIGEATPGPQRSSAKPANAPPARTIVSPPKPQRARTAPKGAQRIPRL